MIKLEEKKAVSPCSIALLYILLDSLIPLQWDQIHWLGPSLVELLPVPLNHKFFKKRQILMGSLLATENFKTNMGGLLRFLPSLIFAAFEWT